MSPLPRIGLLAQILLHRVGWGNPQVELEAARTALLNEAGGEFGDEALECLQRANLTLDRRDGMYLPGQARHYLTVGLSALENIEAALSLSPSQNAPRRVMDFPNGYGRVTRMLRARFPDARLYGSDIRAAAVDFCAQEFALQKFASSVDVSTVRGPLPVDLIWCGSLLTHINRDKAESLLRLFFRCLRPGGLCVISAHGRRTLEYLETGEKTYLLTAGGIRELLRQYRGTGYGFSSYPLRKGYGISLVNSECMETLLAKAGDWELLAHRVTGWDEHQDIYIIRKSLHLV
jgi:SAM-dependent methyltransferase